MTDGEPFTREAFAQHAGSRFRVAADGYETVELELVEVTDLSGKDPNRGEQFRSEPFSLLFRGPGDVDLAQQIYQLEHDALGSLDLFLVPVGPDKDGSAMCYEAIFN